MEIERAGGRRVRRLREQKIARNGDRESRRLQSKKGERAEESKAWR
jgi:hypothetical protein